ncbi:PREDICTED: 60 kDa lysophospholipase [Myotis davidii]|uniref:60 kDa lysophospholipase n=1 Tax=Myotis davidii TaxID=225400 RepID=UPI000767147F|nr:PREDICTED: 60 kDa lysophospholipase [Myotis davidii]
MPMFHDEEHARARGLHQDTLVLPPDSPDQRILYTVLECQPLFDSSDMTITEWVQIAQTIEVAGSVGGAVHAEQGCGSGRGCRQAGLLGSALWVCGGSAASGKCPALGSPPSCRASEALAPTSRPPLPRAWRVALCGDRQRFWFMRLVCPSRNLGPGVWNLPTDGQAHTWPFPRCRPLARPRGRARKGCRAPRGVLAHSTPFRRPRRLPPAVLSVPRPPPHPA